MVRQTSGNPSLPRSLTRRTFLAGFGTITALAASGCRLQAGQASDDRVVLPEVAADGTPVSGPGLREKIGQMVLTGFRGLSIDPGQPIATTLRAGIGAGVVLFDYDVPASSPVRNIASPAQVAALTAQLRDLAGPTALVAVDEEGGSVARLGPTHGFPATRSAAGLGARDDAAATYAAASAIAQTLRAAGITVNFAPDVDLNVNPGNPVIGALDRSFSADPAVVVRQAEAFTRAHHDRGLLCTLKHFPGHGSSTADSHLGFVDVTDTWSETELVPFRTIVADGLADIVMTAHIFNAHLDPTYPATLSHATVTGILRSQLGYDGVVISDDMQMGAITAQFGFETAIQKAIEAGIDILLYGNNLDGYDEGIADRIVSIVESLVTRGALSEARITQSYDRVMRLRSRLSP